MTSFADDAEWASRVAGYLPLADVRSLASAAAAGPAAVRELRATTGGPVVRRECDELVARLGRSDPAYLAGVLDGAAATAERSHKRQSVEVVWTGPSSDVLTSRFTAATVTDLIAESRRELLLVSYMVHRDRVLTDALTAAAGRGVTITLVYERHEDNRQFSSEAVPFPGVEAIRLHWPRGSRPSRAALHAKVIVVDDRVALVGSANLTGQAMDANLECGILIRGGSQPRAIRDHITGLTVAGILRPG
jgi:cardiolipin synthase A/B